MNSNLSQCMALSAKRPFAGPSVVDHLHYFCLQQNAYCTPVNFYSQEYSVALRLQTIFSIKQDGSMEGHKM